MATIEIRDVLDNETGETIFPRTHVKAVIGLADSNFFEEYIDGNGSRSVKLRSDYIGLWAEGFVAAGGPGSGGGGGGGLIDGVYMEQYLGTIYSQGGTDDITKTFSAFAIDKIWQTVLGVQQSIPNVSLVNGANNSTMTVNGTTADFYTTAQVDGLMRGIRNFEPVPVQTLPTASADTMYKLYLVPSEDPQSQNIKDEYITYRTGSEGNYTYSWEKVGSTAIDLTGYATESWVNQQGFLTASALNGYATQTWANHQFLKKTGGDISGDIFHQIEEEDVDSGEITFYELWKITENGNATFESLSVNGVDFSTINSHVNTLWNARNNYVTLSGEQTITGAKSFSNAITLSGSTNATRRIYFGDTSHYLELDQYGFHFSHGVYSDDFVSAGGIGNNGGGSGGATELGDLVDVSLSPRSNGDLLVYNSATSHWENKPQSSIIPTVSVSFDDLTSHPTTIAGYGITDAKIANGVITLGGNTITPLTTETDPTVPSWAKAANKPSYSLNEISGTDDLRAIEALTGTAGFLKKTAENTWALDTTQYLSAHQSVTLASGTNNGTLKLTTAAGTVDNIAVKGLQALAYKASLLESDIPDLSGTYVTIAGAQTITGTKTFSGGIVMGGADIVPSADLGSQLGYSNRRFSNLNARTLALLEINFKNQENTAQTGYLAFKNGLMVLRSGVDINSSYKQINFYETYGLYPENGSSINLGYYSQIDNRFRWANIYGVNADLTGNLALASTSHIDIGPARIEYDASNGAIHVTTNQSGNNAQTIGFYADGFSAAGGIGTSTGTIKYVSCSSQAEYDAISPKNSSTIYTVGNPVTKIYLGTIQLYSEN